MNKYRGGAVLVALVLGSSAYAAVTVDENGVGFVGKGDVQSVFDWNNAMLQANAANVRFRMSSGGEATWQCTGVNPQGKTVTNNMSSVSNAVDSAVQHDARKNSQGQVTGFMLRGSVGGSGGATYTAVGTCGNSTGYLVPKSMVDGSLNYDGNGEPTLEVSVDGTNWHQLQISY